MRNTKDKILATTFMLLIRNGYNGVSIGDITKTMAITRSLPYRYFDSKQDIFFEAFKVYFHKRFYESITDYSAISLKELVIISANKLKEIINELSESFDTNISVFDYNRLYFDAIKFEPRFLEYMEQELVNMIITIKSAIAKKEIADVDVDFVKRIFLDIFCRCDNLDSSNSNEENLQTIINDFDKFYKLLALH